jgi:hypothetical protein
MAVLLMAGLGRERLFVWWGAAGVALCIMGRCASTPSRCSLSLPRLSAGGVEAEPQHACG